MAKVQSVEPNIADLANGWLKSKNGGVGGNRLDAKFLLQDKNLNKYSILIEYKVYSKELMMFFVASMCESIKEKYSYGKKLRSSQSLNLKMKLPVIDSKSNYHFTETELGGIL